MSLNPRQAISCSRAAAPPSGISTQLSRPVTPEPSTATGCGPLPRYASAPGDGDGPAFPYGHEQNVPAAVPSWVSPGVDGLGDAPGVLTPLGEAGALGLPETAGL